MPSPISIAKNSSSTTTVNLEAEGPLDLKDEASLFGTIAFFGLGALCELGCVVSGAKWLAGGDSLDSFKFFSLATGAFWAL